MTESSQVSNLEKFNNVYQELEEDVKSTFKSLKVKKSENNLKVTFPWIYHSENI